MENNTMKSLENFLKEYDIDEKSLTDKEKIKVLKNIILHHKVDKDLTDLKYSKMPVEEKTKETRNEFVNSIDNLDIRIMNATGYILLIKSIQKEERKLKRKQAFCKVLGIKSKNKK